MPYHDAPYHHGTPVLPWLFLVAFLVLLALAAYALVRGFHARPAPPAEGDALAILRLRYARGEISRDEFLQANADLGGGAVTAS